MNNKIYPFLQKFIFLFILIGHLGNGRLIASKNSLFSYAHSCASTELFTGAIEIFISAPRSIFDNLVHLVLPLFSSPTGYSSIVPTLLRVPPCLNAHSNPLYLIDVTAIYILNLMIATFAWTVLLTIGIKFKIFDYPLTLIGKTLLLFLQLIAWGAILIVFLVVYAFRLIVSFL